jgi:transposase InsO family protein
VPWKVSDVWDERVKFVVAALRGEEPHAVVCAAYGISRETGYKWIERYHAGGWEALRDGSRARHSQAHAMAPEIAAALLALRRSRPSWGPKKLRAYLMGRQPDLVWPVASTIGDLLRREGLVEARRRQRRLELAARQPFAEAKDPNDVWCIDFKGWFRTRDGRRCDPLTVSDAVSRYLLSCQIVAPTTEGVAPVCERLFREHGLPKALRMDNGPPFASSGAGGLTRLAVSWIKLGIRLERIDPGCPQQNGRHERMHRTLKADTSKPPAESVVEQQARFDRFRRIFNEERPHEALGQVTPASCYRVAERPYPERIEEPWYDADHQVRRVRTDGTIRWRGEFIFISEALSGEPVGLAEREDGSWSVQFADLPLGLIDAKERIFRRFVAPRPGRHKPATTRDSVSHVPGL